jgi:plastocyanin
VRNGAVRRALLILVALSLSGAAAADTAKGAAAATHTVVIENMQFNPPQLTVHASDRIVWVNKDLFPHTVTADAKAFDSGSIAVNGSWRYVARKKGSFAYSCTFHPTMKGKITVE